jgi:hypothetical protein
MSLAILGARGLFSVLQEAFRNANSSKRLRLSPAVHQLLADFRWLANDLHGRPTRIAEVIPHEVQCVGACDAASTGMGGVHFIPLASGTLQPILWRAPFAQSLQDILVSYAYPQEQSLTATSSWQAQLHTTPSLHNNMTSASAQSIRYVTTLRLSAGSQKARAPPSAQELICCPPSYPPMSPPT